MQKTIISSLLAAALFAFNGANVIAQAKLELMAQDKDFFEVREIMYNKFEGKSFIKGRPNYDKEFKQFKRWENRMLPRLMSNGSLPQGRLTLEAWEAMEAASNGRSNGDSDWEYFGPTSSIGDFENMPPQLPLTGMGRVNSIAIHPENTDIILAGPAGAGVWKSTDRGESWEPKMDFMPITGISDIVFDPNNPDIVYALSGDAHAGYVPFVGLLKSIDGGETWSIIALETPLSNEYNARRIAMPASSPNTLYITTTDGIYKSTDGGESFVELSEASPIIGFDIELAVDNDDIVFIGTSDGKIFKTLDAGDTWQEVTPSSISLEGRIELATTPNDPNLIMAIDAMGRVIKSTDAGASWTQVGTPPAYQSQDSYDMTLAISPNNSDLVIAGGVTCYRSQDGGLTWENYLVAYPDENTTNPYMHPDHQDAIFMPGGSDTLFAAHDGGIGYGDINDNTKRFKDISSNLYITQYYGIGPLRGNNNTMIAGAQDNDIQYFKEGEEAISIAAADGVDGVINYNSPNISYATVFFGITGKTTDYWETFDVILDENDISSLGNVTLAMHPTNPDIIYIAGDRVKKSEDAGENWEDIFPREDLLFNELAIRDMDVSSSNPEVILFSTLGFNLLTRTISSRLLLTVDDGDNWVDLTDNLPDDIFINKLAIHPTNPNIMAIAIGGYMDGLKVMKTEDGGLTWTNISYNLPNVVSTEVVFAAGTNDLYLGTDLGLWINESGAQDNWEQYNNNLPYTSVAQIEFDYINNVMIAATYGRGIWKSPIANTISSNDELEYNNSASIYPNPSNGVFNLQVGEGTGTYELSIYNVAGGIVYHGVHNESSKQFNFSHIHQGTYFVSIKKEGKSFVQKLVIN